MEYNKKHSAIQRIVGYNTTAAEDRNETNEFAIANYTSRTIGLLDQNYWIFSNINNNRLCSARAACVVLFWIASVVLYFVYRDGGANAQRRLAHYLGNITVRATIIIAIVGCKFTKHYSLFVVYALCSAVHV